MGGMAGGDGGSRRVEVSADRITGWLDRFAARHGAVTTDAGAEEVVVTAADGAVATLQVPFPPMQVDEAAPDGGLAAHALRSRRVGVLLVRLGGHAVGVFDGEKLVVSKVGSRQVHGRSAAGGWSQQRFARRREGQVRVALAAAADLAVTLLVPVADTLDAVVVGGDRRSVEAVLDDPRLGVLRPLVMAPLLDVPDPRRAVLDTAPARYRAVRVLVVDGPAPQ
jgi:hypothetical protein